MVSASQRESESFDLSPVFFLFVYAYFSFIHISFLHWQERKLASLAWGRASEPLFKRLYICAPADSEFTGSLA